MITLSAIGFKFGAFAALLMGAWATILDVTTVRALLVAGLSGVLTIIGQAISSRQARENREHILRVEDKVSAIAPDERSPDARDRAEDHA